MKLLQSFGLMAAAGALMAAAPATHATVTFKSSVSIKLTAIVQDSVEVETSDGYEDTAVKLTIVNKDILAAFEAWWPTTLPSGADITLDENYNLVIVDKDGDILYDDNDLDGFLALDYEGPVTSDGRYREKDNGDYSAKFTQMYLTEFVLLGSNFQRNADLNSATDGADLQGLNTYTYTDTYDASKTTYKETATDNYSVSGPARIENSDAVVSGVIKGKYSLKDTDAKP